MIHVNIQKKLQGAMNEMVLDVDFTIEHGSFVTLFGASGAGKTSILRIIAGLMRPDAGQINMGQEKWFDSEKGIDRKPQERKIGFVFQDYALFPNMSVKENLLFALEKNQNPQVVEELIQIIELEDLQHRKPEKLSGGQKQRVALARALVRKPTILMLDEPLSALDAKMRTRLQDYILKVHKQFNLTTLLISHEVSEVIKMCDRVFMIENGRILKEGKPMEVFANQKLSGKFQFSGEIIEILEQEIICIVTVLVGMNFVKVIADKEEIKTMNIGDKVLVASKAFNPVLQKIE
ncbi:molybdate transport system ATP-binding protein [Aquimarina spongiae]|uniref:Molybdate transport system ATP-binding protein n=2 Tax=Aquimarina spongiae TaxID=570521 RepID=A0A1M6H1U7_9FLAO|nr:molybdate transport system ATP-binding protein [Aquimarina spongiae]